MLFSKNFFAVLLAVAAVGVNGSPAGLEEREYVTCDYYHNLAKRQVVGTGTEPAPSFTLCNNDQLCCRSYYDHNACHNVGQVSQDASVYAEYSQTQFCTVYRNYNCEGDSRNLWANGDLGDFKNIISSFRCYKIGY